MERTVRNDEWGLGWMMPFFGVFWIVIVVLVIAAAVRFTGYGWRGGDIQSQLERRSPGLDVLEERYARGEINRDEYLQKTKDITGKAA